MSGEAERGTRFARDLRRIRRARGVSLTDIHDATKMAYDLIKLFEHNALIGHPQFNRVYLRLFVRGYAEHLGMDVEMTLEALELAMKGRYTDSLAKAYLGESGEEGQKESSKKGEKTGREEPAAPESDQVTEETSSVQAEKKSSEIPHEKSEGSTPQSDSAATDLGATAPKTSPTEQPVAQKISSPKGVADRSASSRSSSKASPSKAAGVRSSAGSDSGSGTDPRWIFLGARSSAGSDSGSGTDPRWIFLGLFVVVVGLGIWGLTRAISGPDELAQQASLSSERIEPANDMADAAAPASTIPPQSLPDTLNIVIVADKGGVAPIRVTVDNDLRRPYWIDRGNAMTFRMVDRIILEQQLDSVTVQVEGMTYPVSRPAGEDMVTLTRDAVRSWFSSIQP